MNIHVNQIPAEGRRDHASYDPRSMDMERSDVHLDQPFEVDAFIVLADEELVVNANIRCPLRLDCARCLEAYDTTITLAR